jgi:tRNA pseudouridine38-40 synthase
VEAPDANRLLLTVHYDGSAFHGWQIQPDRRTVQGALEEVLSRLAARPTTVLASGRTDTGVHARGQAVAVDMSPQWSPAKLRRSLNALLPEDIWVESVVAVRPDFHPRYDAVARTYTYAVGTDPASASPFERRWCWALGEALDTALLAEAATYLLGKRSFAAFAKTGQPERGEECTVRAAAWSAWRLGPLFTITADRYLHHMVRYLVGTMVDVGLGNRPVSDVPRLLAKDTALVTSPPAPPQGLFLTGVEYAEGALLDRSSSAAPSRRTAPV